MVRTRVSRRALDVTRRVRWLATTRSCCLGTPLLSDAPSGRSRPSVGTRACLRTACCALGAGPMLRSIAARGRVNE